MQHCQSAVTTEVVSEAVVDFDVVDVDLLVDVDTAIVSPDPSRH